MCKFELMNMQISKGTRFAYKAYHMTSRDHPCVAGRDSWIRMCTSFVATLS